MSSTTRIRTSRFAETIGTIAVVAGLVLGLVPGIAIAAHSVPDIGAGEFEIDGNAGGDHDWDTLGGEQTPDATGQTDTIFTPSQTEATYPNWSFVQQQSPQKADLLRLFVNSQSSAAGSFVWLGAQRDSSSGDVQVTAEFNKNLESHLMGDYRSVGDFYIRFNFPGSLTGVVDVGIAQWQGNSWGTEKSVTTGFRYAIGDLGVSSREFVELELDLAGIFGEGEGQFDCGTFGGVSFRTEASGSGVNPTLKDVGGPFPVDLDTCANVTVEKVDAEGNPLNGVEFTAYEGHDATTDGTEAASCITGPDTTDADPESPDSAGECSLGAMLPGDYTLHETAWPAGYRASPELDGGDNFTVQQNTSLDLPDGLDEYDPPLTAYTDPRIDYTIDVEPDGRNAVGNAHTFTVSLTDDTATGVSGADIDLTWSGAAADVTSVTQAGPDPDTLDCTTGSTGECTVVVSGSIGTETLSASWTTPYQTASGDGGVSTDGEAVASISDSAAKTWVGYVASIEETATNLVSNGDTAGEHDFAVTVKEDDGSGTLTTPDASVEVTVTWTGAPDDATITPADLTCDTDTNGQCTFTVDSPTPGAGTITIVQLDGTILGFDDQSTDDDEDLVDDSPTVEPGDGKSLSADKTWREYRALIDGDAINPVGEPHTFHVQVQYREDDNAASWTDAIIEDLTVAWNDSGSAGSVDTDASTCDNGTDTEGHCTIVVDTDDDPGSRKVSLLSVTGDLLPDDVPDNTGLTYTFDDAQYDETEDEFREATKTWIEFGANIISDGKNLVSPDGESMFGEHTFTITVWRKPAPGSDMTAVPAETKVTTNIDWDSDHPRPTDLVRDNNCLDDGTSNVEFDGSLYSQCTITLNSTVPGVATVTPTGLVGYDYGDDNGSQGVTFADGNTESAVKTWYRYRAWIDADSTNLAGDPEGDHDFTVTVQQDSGGGWGPVPHLTTVTVTSPDATNDGTLENASCDTTTTAGVSSCTIAVSSLLPGSRTVTVDTVQALAVDNTPIVDVSNGEYLDVDDPTQRTAATKTWVTYSATISADATNLTGQDHVFAVTAFVDSGDGPVAAPAGTKLTIDVDGDFLSTDVADPNTCDGDGTGDQTNPTTEQPAAANECFVTVSSDSVDEVTVTVTHVTPVAGTVDDIDPSDGIDPTDDITDVDATKTWIAARVDVSDDATNIVGESHAFDVTVTVLSPDNPNGVAAPDGTTVAVTSTGVGRVVEDDETDPVITGSTCDEGTTGGTGTCTVVVYSEASGDRSITVDSVTLGATSFGAIDMDGTDGVASGNDLDGTKTWRAYRASIASDGLNLVRDEHPFTVTVQQTDEENPIEFDWTAVPDGTTATVTLGGTTGSISSNDCDAPDGTSGDTGTCTVIVDSSSAGTATVTVSEIGVARPDDPQATVTVDVTNDSATKTWVAFRGQLSADSLNITGDEHTFDVLVEYTTNGADWDPVPDESTVTYTNGGTTGSVLGDTCDSTELENEDQPDERVCTITVDTDLGDDAGTRTVTLTGVSARITVGELTEDFDVTFPAEVSDEPSGVLDGFDLEDYEATKTWASYTLTLDPASAVNLLSGQSGDPERYHTITATLDSDDATNAPVGNQTIEVTISGDTGVIVAVDNDDDVDVTDDSTFEGTIATDGLSATCTTAADGTCDIVIFSDTPGQATVSGSYEATVGDSKPVTIEDDGDAVKTWTTFRVTVTPETAVNLVDNPHTFTVTIEQSKPAADCDDGDGDGWCPVVGAVPTATVTGTGVTLNTDDCDGGTDAAGQCEVVATSSTVQAVTLTATYTESYAEYDTEITGSTGAVFSDSGDKSWIDYDIDVDPDTDENLVETDHVFTVTVTTTVPDGEGGTTTMGVVGATPEVFLSGPGTITDNTCDAPDGTLDDDPGTEDVDETGTCTVAIRSGVPGLSTLDAHYLGVASGVDPEDPSDDESRSYDTRETEEDDSGDKLWVDYLLELSPDAVNAVGDPHTFTATLRRSEDGADDEDYLAVEGQTLTFTVGGVGTVTGGDTDGALECTTDTNGQCDIVINSDEAGATEVGVSYDAVVGATSRTDTDGAVKQWVDIELVKTAVTTDGFSDGDLIADPGGFPFLAFTSSDPGPKTAVFEYSIHNPSDVTLENVVLTDDRLGAIDLADFPDCQTLDPDEFCTARGSEQFDYDDATGSLASLITNVGTVTATGGGEEVSDTDDATITLVAVQSSILIDLVKDVVAGEGDVEEFDGRPIINWSQEEYEAGESKTVRYRFTVTNISNSPIIDVELLDPMISDQPLIAKTDGVTLQPGESTVVEVDHQLTVGEAFPDGPIASKVDNVATVSGANETRDSFSEASDDASVFTGIVFAEVLEKEEPLSATKPLPATGFGAGGLLPVSMLLITIGAGVLWLGRRRRTIC